MDSNFKSGLDVIYLASCAINSITPDNKLIEDMDLESVYNQAKRHKMLSVTCMALESYYDKLTEDEKELLRFFIDSGSFGRKDVFYQCLIERFANGDGKITKGSKVRYFLSRLFPTGPYIRENYPFFHKYKILLPVLWIYRFFPRYLLSSSMLERKLNL